jgi:hypothetical protein
MRMAAEVLDNQQYNPQKSTAPKPKPAPTKR